jgi:hypothetical protein
MSALKSSIPDPIYERLRRLKRAYYALRQPLAVTASPSLIGYRHLPGQMDMATIESSFTRYDVATDADKRAVAHDLFYTIALDPSYGRVLGWEYMQQKHAGHPLYRYLHAGLAYGVGEIDIAHKNLSALADESHEPLAALLAGTVWLRPHGNESKAYTYLEMAHQRFPEDIAITITLAQCCFILGNTKRANQLLASIETRWRKLLTQYLVENQMVHEELIKALQQRTLHRHSHYDDTIYAESQIKLHWEPYYRDMMGEPEHLFFGWLRSFYREVYDDMINAKPNLSRVINFGVMCGQAEYESAQTHSSVEFVGVDRQNATKEFNNIAYHAPNLRFLAGEMEELLPSLVSDGAQTGFFHARTTTLLYPERVRQLYRQCAKLGIHSISVFENLAPNHHAYRYFDYADFPDDAIIYKNHQFIHHYPRYLEEAGYKIIEERRIASPSVQADSAIDWGSTHVYLRATLNV